MSNSETGTAGAKPFLKAWDDYAAASRVLFEQLGNHAAHVEGAVPPAFSGYWNDFAKSLGMRSDLAGGQFKPEHMFASFLPALGYTREYQEIAQRLCDLSGQFQRRYAEFMQQGADIGQCALQAVRMRSTSDAGVASSTSAIYDAWIDSAEQAYAQAAHGESFAQLLAELCNLLSAFKIERGKLLDALARHLDWPSRAEVDSLHRQVRDLTIAARNTTAQPSRPPAAKPKTRKPRKPVRK